MKQRLDKRQRKSTKPKAGFENINKKIDKPLAGLTKKKEKTQMTKTRNENGDVITVLAE